MEVQKRGNSFYLSILQINNLEREPLITTKEKNLSFFDFIKAHQSPLSD
jgi:hypothetical protein